MTSVITYSNTLSNDNSSQNYSSQNNSSQNNLSQNNSSQNTVSNNTVDELGMILQELKPFAQALTEDIENKPICKATAIEIAIAMIGDIVIKILDFQEKQLIFSKKVIMGLWSIPCGEHKINLIELLYEFMTICSSYPNANFKKSTYGATISKKLSSDINYNIDPKQAYIPLKDCKFALMLKVWRIIICRSINNTTGKYSIPTLDTSETWRFMIFDENNKQHLKTSKEFINYTLKIGNQIYSKLDKLSSSLSEIYEIFNNAALASKFEKEQKIQLNKPHYFNHKRCEIIKDTLLQDKTGFVQEQSKVDWKKIDTIAPPPSVWKKNVKNSQPINLTNSLIAVKPFEYVVGVGVNIGVNIGVNVGVNVGVNIEKDNFKVASDFGVDIEKDNFKFASDFGVDIEDDGFKFVIPRHNKKY